MYATINGWTKERIKEQIRARNNGTPAKTPEDPLGHFRCLYLTDDGNRCAAGVFIPDGHPAQSSTLSISSVLDDHPDLYAAMPLGMNGMYALQAYGHDRPAFNATTRDMRDVMCEWIDLNVVDSVEGAP